MDVVFSSEQQAHHPKQFLVSGVMRDCPEIPQRAQVLEDAARAAGHRLQEAEDRGLGPIAAVHTPEYLEFLESIHDRWRLIEGSSEEVLPNVHPQARHAPQDTFGYPQTPVGRAGYHMADTACPISAGTWRAALAAAWTALQAGNLVYAGAPAAYALCRPPGHHAYADMAGGFCYLNNTAIVAQDLTASGRRVAVLDVDLHHGNGTQGIFYRRGDVLTVSLHADPARFYPFFWGHAQERGEGQGLGANLNLPLELGTGDEGFLEALSSALQRVGAFAADTLVVALGLDAYEQDPLAGLKVSTPGFARIGEAIAALGLPTVLVQEGGYPTPALGDNLVSFLGGFESAHRI